MTKTQKSILSGVTVLSAVGIICKLVGVLFSIPLTWIIGAEGLGIFQAVFPTYNLLLTISSAGLPVAVSKTVSHYLAKDDPRNAKRTFKAALWLLTALGLFCTILMLCSNAFLVERVSEPQASLGFTVIAPCVAIVCVISAFRGFMQGQQNMVPTAISQLIEQVGKVFVSLPLAYFGARIDLAHGAAGALLGITLAEAAALIYMLVLFRRKDQHFLSLSQAASTPEMPLSTLGKRLMGISIPITIGACIVPLSQFIDSAMLVSRMMDAGLTLSEARPLYGLFSGLVIRLINVPTALALAIAMSLVPAISATKATEDLAGIRRHTDMGIRFSFLIGLPCSIGMSFLSKQIIAFLYQETLSPEHLQIASELLSVSGLTVVLFTVVQASSSILQGLNKQKIPMYTLAAGVVCKIALNYTLVGIPGFHIHGAPVASMVCYTVSMIPNLYYVCKYTGMKVNWSGWILRPGAATVVMGLTLIVLRNWLPMSRLFTLLEVAVGVAVYLGAAVLFKALSKDDISQMFRKKRLA